MAAQHLLDPVLEERGHALADGELAELLDGLPLLDHALELVRDYGAEHWDKVGVSYSPSLRLFRPKGCPKCNGSGYKGRMGIHELIIATDGIKRMIQKHDTVEAMRDLAMSEGMTTLLQDGIIKSVQGLTDFKQVRRVCIK